MIRKNRETFLTALIWLGLITVAFVAFIQVVYGTEHTQHKTEISVILYSAGNGGWEAMQEGFKRAEDDFYVNINYVMLHEDAGEEEEIEAVEREIENGAQGVIVAVEDSEAFYQNWLTRNIITPVVAVESSFSDKGIPYISADNYGMGKKIGEEILKDFSDKKEIKVAYTSEKVKKDSVMMREEGLKDALGERAKFIPLRTVVNGESADVAVALDKETLQNLLNQSSPMINSTKKYGIGNTPSIVAALDQGRIEKLVFQNEFSMGYLAVEAVLGESTVGMVKDGEIDYYCVGREQLYESPFEQLLFPIVE